MDWKLNLLLAFFFIFPLDLQFRQCFIIAFLRVLVIGAMRQKLTFPIYYREGLNGQVFILCGSMSVKKAGLSWPSPGVPDPRPLEEADTFLELTWPRLDCGGCGWSCIHENDRSKRKFYYPTLVPVTQAFIWTFYTEECQAFSWLTCEWTIIMYGKIYLRIWGSILNSRNFNFLHCFPLDYWSSKYYNITKLMILNASCP